MQKHSSYIAILLLAVGCGHATTDDLSTSGANIVGGDTVKAKSTLAKSIVALKIEKEEGEGLCTGSLLSENLVLTAAHCVDEEPKKVEVLFTTQAKRVAQNKIRAADHISIHPIWSRETGYGDLALIHFTGGLPKGYKPVQLADSQTQLNIGDSVTEAGYGASKGGKATGTGRLRQTTTTVVGQRAGGRYVLDGKTSSACFGDSGGPVFLQQQDQLIQWGVTSGVNTEDCDNASIHTAIMSYLPWLQSTTQQLQTPSPSRQFPEKKLGLQN